MRLIEVLLHLRRSGMPLREIAEFTGWVQRDRDGVAERLCLLEAHHRRVLHPSCGYPPRTRDLGS